MTVKAIYENGVFTPVHPVNLPEKFEVEIPLPEDDTDFVRREAARKEITEILSHRHNSGQTDTAERHNEHQP